MRRRAMSERKMRYVWRGKAGTLCFAIFATAGLITPASAAVANPDEAVRSFYGVLLGNMQQGRMLGESGRYAKLAPVIDRTFDIPLNCKSPASGKPAMISWCKRRS